MCPSHWRRVSKPLQDTLWLLYHNGDPRDGFEEALRNAIEQVDEMIFFPTL